MQLQKFVSAKLPLRERELLKALSLYFQGKAFHVSSKLSSQNECKLPNKVLVGTHHKAGTVWLHHIFKKICRLYNLNYSSSHRELPEFDIFLHYHSQFNFDSIHSPYRGVHIIRDPRDLIISGSFYHQKSSEKWLHIPKERFQGLTYQQKINSYDSFDDKILFEMEHSGHNTISQILEWDYHNPLFYEIKYENLMQDTDLTLFHQIFSFIGFPGSIIPNVLMIAYRNSLFSGNVRSKHVRSGKSKQWSNHFKPIHKRRFVELFDDALIKLGY
ncbi:MAG: sulfotransferase domain-containing protein, partial [Cyanobacteria bacterium P01_H01_bin.15]